jgi:hypothetical protein
MVEPPSVVVVSALGAIVQSAPQGGPASGERFVESVKLTRALQQIRKMDHVSLVWCRALLGFGAAPCWAFEAPLD